MLPAFRPRLTACTVVLLLCHTSANLAAAANAFPPTLVAAHQEQQPADSRETKEPPQAQPITEADRIVRLQATIADADIALTEERAQLEKRRGEEETAGGELQKIAEQVESLTQQLQKADGDPSEARQIEEQLTPLQKEQQLAKEQFDLAVQARKTAQEQVATLETRIEQDKQALAKLQGLEVPPSETPDQDNPAPTEPNASATATDPTAATAAGGLTTPPGVAPPAQERKAPKTKAEKEARKQVEEKETALADLEGDLEKLIESQSLLEKDIELESQTLETARKQYDNLEESLTVAETNFNDRLKAGDSASELSQLRQRIGETQKQMRDNRASIRTSTDRLQDLRKQLSELQAEDAALTAQAKALQRQAKAAKRSEWLVKAQQYAVNTGPKLLAIVAGMMLLWTIVKFIGARTRKGIERDAIGTQAERQHRSETLIGVFQTTANAVIAIGGFLMMLEASGIPIGLLLGGAGVVGLAIAFAAQSLIKDYFCGFLLLLENQFRLGDMISIGDMTGNVERMTLRITVLRNFDGHVFYIPNGQINAVKNLTAGWARVVLDVGVAYKEDVDNVINVLMQVANRLKVDAEHGKSILGDPEMFGVDQLADSSVVVRLGLKVRPQRQWGVKRELLRRIKQRFDELGIEIPFPQRTVHHRMENGKPAPLLGQSEAVEKN